MIPQIVLTVIDPGALALPANTDQKPIYAGVSESGTDYEIREFAREEDLLAYGGAGHNIDVAQAALQTSTSVKIMKLPRSTAGTFEALGTDDPLTAASFSGTPLQFLKGKIVVTVGGTLVSGGAVKAKITLDDWDVPFVDASYGDEFTIAASGIVVLPNTGGCAVHITTSLTPGAGDSLSFVMTPGHYNSTAVGDCLDPLLSPTSGEFTFVVFTGEAQTASAANTIAVAVASLKDSLYAKGRFYPMLCGTGLEDDVTTAAAFAATQTDPPFLSGGYGAGYRQSPRPTPTRGRFALREHELAAMRITAIKISTDPGRGASGALANVLGVDYDAAQAGSLLHDARIGTLRNWHPEADGYFITRQRMLAKSDSNFESWQFAAMMCFALRAVRHGLFLYQLETLRRTPTSTLDPRDAADIQATCESLIDQVLIVPENERGLPGHISARKVTVSLTTQFPQISVGVSIRPHGYSSDLRASLEYGNAT